MNDNINVTEASEVVYQRGQCNGQAEPEFKPGNMPHTQYGEQTLNANVPWHSVVLEILTKDYSIAKLAEAAKTTTSTIRKIIAQDYSSLDFRTGARLLGVHVTLYPETM